MKIKISKRSKRWLGSLGRFFPCAWVLVLLFLIVELFIYPGVFSINSFVPIIGLFLLGFIFYLFPATRIGKLEKLFIQITKRFTVVLFLITLLSYFYFTYAESINYPNYVFTYFHLHFRHLLYINVASAVYLVFSSREVAKSSIGSYKDHVRKIENVAIVRREFALLILFIPLLLVGYRNIVETTPKLIEEAILTYQYFGKSYDEKMRARWGEFYDYMLLIKENTPEDAVVYHPPQVKPWEFEGNQVLLRYFLYPRALVSGSIAASDYEGPEITHILIVWGRRSPGIEGLEFGWPKEEVEASRIVIMGEDYQGPHVYIPGDDVFKEKRGLIEL